jgi:hypothetical protein
VAHFLSTQHENLEKNEPAGLHFPQPFGAFWLTKLQCFIPPQVGNRGSFTGRGRRCNILPNNSCSGLLDRFH